MGLERPQRGARDSVCDAPEEEVRCQAALDALQTILTNARGVSSGQFNALYCQLPGAVSVMKRTSS
jgi:hypothetical protein